MNLVSPFPLIALPVVLLNHTHGWIEFNAGKDTVPRVAAAFCGSTDAAAFDPSSYLPEPDSTSLQMTTEESTMPDFISSSCLEHVALALKIRLRAAVKGLGGRAEYLERPPGMPSRLGKD